MPSSAKLPAIILLVIILLGGFGIVRVIVTRHDAIGLLAIVASLVLCWLYMRLATSTQPWVGNAIGMPPSKWPIKLGSTACDTLEVFPDRPEGYVLYTDYTAMSVDVNDDLASRQPAEQYALLGFGNGFLEGIRKRMADSEGHSRIRFRVDDASQKHRESIGWLAYLQISGTDNAGPSTDNLHSVIQKVSGDVTSNGPVTMKFWDKVRNKQNESLDSDGTTPKMLEEWVSIYQRALLEGRQLSLGAAIVATPG